MRTRRTGPGPRIRSVCVVLVALLLLAACDGSRPDAVPTPEPTPTLEASNPAPPGQPEPAAEHQLVLWLPQFLGVGQDNRAGDLLASVFHQYEQANPGVRLDVQIKAEHGVAGMSSYLRTAQRVAPSILPDIILIETQQLWQMVDLGLIPPLALNSTDEFEDYYPFAPTSVVYNDIVYGIPYLADIVHVAYQSDRQEPPPTQWEDLLASGHTYLFPAAGGDAYANAHILLQYVGAGGELLADGSLSDPDALEAVFEFLVEAQLRSVIPNMALETAAYNTAWEALTLQQATMIATSSEEYMQQRDAHPELGYSQIPTRDGTPATIARVWAFAILTQDAARRDLALSLIARMFATDVQGPLSETNRRLPTRRDALFTWTREDAYVDLLDTQLRVAVALPNGRAFADFARRVQTAQFALLNGDLTPHDARLRVQSIE